MRKPGPKTPGEAVQERVKGIDPDSDMGRGMKRAIQDNETVATTRESRYGRAGVSNLI